jgi:hypothetical protein
MSESPIPRVRRKELPSDGVWAGGAAAKLISAGRRNAVIIGRVRNSLRVDAHLLWFLKSNPEVCCLHSMADIVPLSEPSNRLVLLPAPAGHLPAHHSHATKFTKQVARYQ